jgi:hypothetical protein
MSDLPYADRLAKVAAWCRTRADELGKLVRDVSGPINKFPFPEYGDDCERALAFAIDLVAPGRSHATKSAACLANHCRIC